ncbi:MAG: PKD domain-containing protein, partial [Myxococcales bacterium]|nr:PKD domain-containing protein [Myxococcales bacterium]
MRQNSLLRIVPLTLTALCALGGAAMARVDVAGAINADTTWRAADGPYVMTGSVTVRAGATLSIEPGTAVQGGGAAVELIVEGGLIAVGNAQAPVVFSGLAQGRNAWEGLDIRAGASISLAFAQINDADFALQIARPVAANLNVSDVQISNYNSYGVRLDSVINDAMTLTRVDVDGIDNRTTAIYAAATNLTLEGGSIRNAAVGLDVSNGTVTVRHVVFANNNSRAINFYVNNNTRTFPLTIENCTFYGNGDSILFGRGSSFSYDPELRVRRSIFEGNTRIARDTNNSYPSEFISFAENVYSGTTFANTTPPADLATSLNYRALLADPDNADYQPTDRSPARYWGPGDPAQTAGALPFAGAPTGEGLHGFWYVNRTFEANTVTRVEGDVVITRGVTMTFRPGAQFRMPQGDVMAGGLDAARTEVRVEGTLEADGTNTRPVRFTSDEGEPARSDWYGIVILADTEAFNVAQVDLGYAYRGVSLYSNDHIVAGSRIHDCGDAGIYISGGTPSVEEVIIEDSRDGMRIENQSRSDLVNVTVRRNDNYGIYLHRSDLTVDQALVHDNGNVGVYIYSDNRDFGGNVTLDHGTIAHNAREGILAARGSSFSYAMVLNLRNSSVTNNARAGVRDGNTSYAMTFNCTTSNVWSNAPDLSGVAIGNNGCFSYNPLYADVANRNYEPTRWSPNRGLGVGGGHVGALPYVDAIGPHIMGYLWEDFTFTRQGSPYPVLGDIVVPAGVTVNFEPGAELRVATTDGMAGGVDASRGEIRFLPGATAIIGTPPGQQPAEGIAGAPVVFRSAADPATSGSWYGLHFTQNGTSSVYNVEVRHPRYGAYVNGPTAPPFKFFKVLHHNTEGMRFDGVWQAPAVDVLGAFIVGPRRTAGTGVYFNNSTGQFRSSYVTHHTYGAQIYSSDRDHPLVVDLTNNTLVKHNTGISFSRGSSFTYNLAVNLYNNIVADNSVFAVRDTNRNYSTTLRMRHNNLFRLDRTDVVATENVGNFLTDPNIEDIDWDDVPRWWDGKVWTESLAINAGDRGVPRLPVLDITGRPRVIDGQVDAGAWEHHAEDNEEPRADGVTDAIMVPRGEAFQLDGSAAFDPDGQIASAFWTMSDGTITAGLNVQHTFETEGSDRWAYLTVIDDQGAEDHAKVDVNVNVRPIADAGPSVFQDEGPAESVFFDGTLSTDPDGQIVRWVWDFGDGTPIVEEQSPRHSYLSAGLYTVRLTVTDNEGLTDSDTTIATVFGNVDVVGPLIEHNSIADGQPLGQPVVVRATIRDPANVASAVLFYRPIGDPGARFLAMAAVGGNQYEATIPGGQVVAPGIEYWFVAVDGVQPEPNQSTLPANAPEDTFDFLVLGDPNPPVILHQPVADGQAPGQAVAVTATITDATGLSSVVLFFRAQGGAVFGAAN